MRDRKMVWTTAVTAIAAVSFGLYGCGDGDDSPDATVGAEPSAPADEPGTTAGVAADVGGPADGQGVVLVIAELCDPLDADVRAVLGTDATTRHNDVYAAAEVPLLDCGWESTSEDRTVRVGYNAAPDESMIGLSEESQDLPSIDAPNTYAPSRLDLLAPQGWSITIQSLGADRVEDAEAMAAIALAALAAVAGTATS